jgi:hypothetical protein
MGGVRACVRACVMGTLQVFRWDGRDGGTERSAWRRQSSAGKDS